MSDPSNTVAPDVFLQVSAAANSYESFGRSIASSVLQAGAQPTHSINISASAEPAIATHGEPICVTVAATINGVRHAVTVCVQE